MTIQFNIDYATVFGQELVINVVLGQETSVYRMHTDDGLRWFCTINNAERLGLQTIDYFYSIQRGDVAERTEWQVEPHRLELSAEKATRYCVFDRWISIPEDSYQYSAAFTECIARSTVEAPLRSTSRRLLRLKVRAPQLRMGESLYLVGKERWLGGWNIDQALPMTQHNYREWTVDIDSDKLNAAQIDYKFLIKGRYGAIWETGYNRKTIVPQMFDGDVVVVETDQAFFPIENTRVAGTLVPLFSLRSEHSFGVGDFGDLRLMIDWAAKTNQRVLQVLPINDTTSTHTWMDSYPYSAISIYALHPQFADFTELPALAEDADRQRFEALRLELNALPQIDYERVNKAKTEYLQLLFKQEGTSTMRTADYKRFFKEAERWLVPYAYYCHLRDLYGTADFTLWPDHKQWQESYRQELTSSRTALYKKVAFYYYVQYILCRQMQQAHDYARSRGVVLKGDIPIGVNRHGCDVWQEPRYFNLNGQAGAPPDDFSVQGQNWGFPTYNWDAMIADGCQWWVRRFRNMQLYFDAYRIDHVLGFFRIWEIPLSSVTGLLGQFSPSLAMSRDEIEGYGLPFYEDFYTKPYIADWTLDKTFGARAEEVKAKYLHHEHDDIWSLRPEYDTQRKIEAAFSGVTDRDELNLRDGLYSLVSCVLFVRDHKNPTMYHPRISAQLDFVYMRLNDAEKSTFNRLYNDYFYRRNNQFWYGEAMKKLPRLVQATRMLVCAEDLGMVPDCVGWVMNELRILSLELESMPKDSSVRFGVLERNPYRSVCTISSHDMPTLRQWWDEDWDRTQEYFNCQLHKEGPAPHPLSEWLARQIVGRHLESPSMLCILAIQDWLAIDEKLRLSDPNAERVNIPANPHHYWRYRMHLTIEQLLNDDELNDNIRSLISDAKRQY